MCIGLRSKSFFDVLGVEPAVGRMFSASEENSGEPVAVVSYGYWQSRLGESENLAGQSVRVGDRAYSVIGVAPLGHELPLGTELWVPRQPAAENRTAHNWRVVETASIRTADVEAGIG